MLRTYLILINLFTFMLYLTRPLSYFHIYYNLSTYSYTLFAVQISIHSYAKSSKLITIYFYFYFIPYLHSHSYFHIYFISYIFYRFQPYLRSPRLTIYPISPLPTLAAIPYPVPGTSDTWE